MSLQCWMRLQTRKSLEWVVFSSGRGSTLTPLLQHLEDVFVRGVVCNVLKARVLGRSRRWGVPSRFIKQPEQNGIGQVASLFLLGFMKIVSEGFLKSRKNVLTLNVHPSVLPLYPGLKAFERAFLEHGALGASVHQVVAEVDAGPILYQTRFCSVGNSLQNLTQAQARFVLATREQQLIRRAFLRYPSLKAPRGK